MAKWPDWSVFEKLVRDQRYAASEEFTSLKNAVLKSSPDEIDAQAGHAEACAWTPPRISWCKRHHISCPDLLQQRIDR